MCIFSMIHLKSDIGGIEEEFNPGDSDASTIYNSLSPEQQSRFLPLTMGPGRSQRKAIPPRLTHGVNETFDKDSGIQSIRDLLEIIKEWSKYGGTLEELVQFRMDGG